MIIWEGSVAVRDHFIFATMVVKMSSSKSVTTSSSGNLTLTTSKQQNFSIDALLNLENTEKTSTSHSGSTASSKLTTTPATAPVSLLANKTPLDFSLPLNNLPLHAGYMTLPPATFMEPIYRTESANTRESPTSSKPQTPLFPAAYPWTALAALHTSTVQAAAAAFSRTYLPAMMPHGHIDNISEWSEYIMHLAFFS